MTESREQPSAVTSGQLTVEYRGRDQILRVADLHFGSFRRIFLRFFAAPRGSSPPAMASQSQGIQQLLQAEKRAAEKVAEARKRE